MAALVGSVGAPPCRAALPDRWFFIVPCVLFPFVRLLFPSTSGTHGRALANPVRKAYLCKRL